MITAAGHNRGIRVLVETAVRLAIASLLLGSAGTAVQLGRASSALRIHVRYAAETTDAARLSAERELGLLDGLEREAGTWSYRLERRDSANIQRIVTHRLVEDTHFIDRENYRVELDRPDLPRFARTVVEDGRASWLAGPLALAAALVLWSLRHVAVGAARLAYVSVWRARPRLTPRVLVMGVGAATALALPLAVDGKPDEASFVHLYEATSLLAGDHPYRDFFEWGAPLPAMLSAGVQWLSGYRLIGELLLQWCLTAAGVMVAVHLGIRQACSTAPVVAVVPFILLLAPRAGYHFSKLFCFPVMLWLAARYLDRPTSRRSAALGAFTAVAFLFRHDFAVWAALSSALGLALARVVSPETRSVRSFAADAGAYGLLLLLVLLPWAILVGSSEGLASYVAARFERFAYSRGAGIASPYGALLPMNPFTQLRRPQPPEARSGVVAIEWQAVDERHRGRLETQYGLRPLDDDASGRRRYAVDNVNDRRLLGLRRFIGGDSGIDWRLLESADRGAPVPEGVVRWLAQVTMLVPIALIASGVAGLWRRQTGAGAAGRSRTERMLPAERLLSGLVLAGICQTLIREWSYFQIVAPVTAALAGQFVWPRSLRGAAHRALVAAAAVPLLVLTTYAAAVWQPPLWQGGANETLDRLETAARVWFTAEHDAGNALYAYLRACTDPEDKLLITGSTPYWVPYYTHRAMAGGHLDWSIGLRDAPEFEDASLALLRRQSVPFVVGREPNVLTEFDHYPRIRAYLVARFAAVEGTDASLMYDIRRKPVRLFGEHRLPCFR